ncbi:Redoxin [Rubripirellula lacrimiformis]|uniref:Redoxin n=1 Tax=Rubripirellula lacrimiformis TaxID=1930273 RepID=A0A517NBC7_9BACT|nr:peroxiredoxin family protein [Rubripirellula lacrimiformis]QDT04444.1 Redoxin [Rubripirellula lacrimiformis]
MKMIPHLALAAVALSLTVSHSVSAQTTTGTPVDAAKKQLAVGQTAKDFQLPSVGGELSGNVKLSEVNADGPVVLVVLRGFPGYQCPACSAQVGDFIKLADKFAAKNARVLMVYPGPASQLGSHADDFLKGTKLPKPLTFLLDPGFQFTNAYGLRWDAPRETAYPSTIVLDASGKITYAKISATHGGRANAAEVLKAL